MNWKVEKMDLQEFMDTYPYILEDMESLLKWDPVQHPEMAKLIVSRWKSAYKRMRE